MEDPLTNSGGHLELGFKLGSDSITFLNLKTGKRNGLTRKVSENCEGPHLKIAVPLKYGFKEFVDATDPKNITGYSIDIFEAAMSTLHTSPCYDYFIFHGTYDEIVRNVSIGVRLTTANFHLIL
jgi:ionotropic glutamate receptor